MFIFNELQLSRGTLLALADHGSAVCAHLWKQAITPTSLRTSSANRSQSLVLVWKLKPRVQSTSVETHKPHSPAVFISLNIQYRIKTRKTAHSLVFCLSFC